MLFDQVFPGPAAKMEEEEPIKKTWLYLKAAVCLIGKENIWCV